MTGQGKSAIDTLLAESFKELAKKHPIEKITIKEITDLAGVIRPTFYNHFQDKYELLSYIYLHELFADITKGVNYDNWYERLEGFLVNMLKDKRFYSNTLKSNEKIFEHYLFRSMHKLFIRFFYHAVAITRKRSDKAKFFADFYSHGYCGIIIDWATGGMRETPHDVMLKMRELAYENVTIGEGFRQNL